MGLSYWNRLKKSVFFEKFKNIENERFLMQTLLVLSQFGVVEHVPNIIFTYKDDLQAVEVTKVEKITKNQRFYPIFTTFLWGKNMVKMLFFRDFSIFDEPYSSQITFIYQNNVGNVFRDPKLTWN